MSQSNGNGPRKRQAAYKKRSSTFLKFMFVTLAIFAVASVAGWAAMNGFGGTKIEPPPTDTIGLPGQTNNPAGTRTPDGTAPPDGVEWPSQAATGTQSPDGSGIDRNPPRPTGLGMTRKTDFYTFLIIGYDLFNDTDTIMVASYDGVKKEINIISIPRDTIVDIKRRNMRISQSFCEGYGIKWDRLDGVNQLRMDIKTLIGFIPDYYVSVSWTGVVKLIDAIDGIYIDVPYDMEYYDPGNLTVSLKKGRQKLYGEDALGFARYRKGNPNGTITINDYGTVSRITNQQTFVKATLERVLEPANIKKVKDLVAIFDETVTHDIPQKNVEWFVNQFTKISGVDSLKLYTMPMIVGGGSGSPDWYEFMDEKAALELINSTINPYNEKILSTDVSILSKVP